MEPFMPTDSKKVMQMILAGAKRNAELDRIDHSKGAATPLDCGISVAMRAAMQAIAAGMERGTWKEVAEGMALLMRAEHLVRQLEGQLEIVVNNRQ